MEKMADVPNEFQVQTKHIICVAELILKNANDSIYKLQLGYGLR